VMDPLSGAASVIAVVELSSTVLDLCRNYISKVKKAKEDIQRLSSEVEAFSMVLVRLKGLVHGPEAAKLPTSGSLDQVIQQCHDELEGLKEKLNPNLSNSQQKMKRFGLRALKWPLTRKEVDETIAALEKHKATLNTTLSLDQM
jgi:Fungal N-terminal domain of STAND proteins